MNRLRILIAKVTLGVFGGFGLLALAGCAPPPLEGRVPMHTQSAGSTRETIISPYNPPTK